MSKYHADIIFNRAEYFSDFDFNLKLKFRQQSAKLSTLSKSHINNYEL